MIDYESESTALQRCMTTSVNSSNISSSFLSLQYASIFHFMIFIFIFTIVFCLGANIHFKLDIWLHSSFQDCEQQWRETCESSLLWCSYSCGLLVIFSVNSQETRLVKQKLIVSCKLIFLLKYFWDQAVLLRSTKLFCQLHPTAVCNQLHVHTLTFHGSTWQLQRDTSTQDAKTKGGYSCNTCKLFACKVCNIALSFK